MRNFYVVGERKPFEGGLSMTQLHYNGFSGGDDSFGGLSTQKSLSDRDTVDRGSILRSDPKTILVVDDEPNVLSVVAADLRYAGFEVLCACCGEEALALLRTHPVHVVVSDILMPGMSGPELLKAVRTLKPDHAAVPFIFLSALSGREDVIAARRLGVDDYLTKPVDFDLLAATIDANLKAVARVEEAERVAADAVVRRLQDQLPLKALGELHLALNAAFGWQEAHTDEPTGVDPTYGDEAQHPVVVGNEPIHVTLLAPRRGKWERLSLTYLMHLADEMAGDEGVDVSIESEGSLVYSSKPHEHEIELF